ncbi:Outer membrane protein assembly factor BamB, contains PQQ-like beta-propeller repeat [Chitinophaga rupis]|uniref:Outer membrane protein assembly factor BamB, contains PQQ-like beta-propeller repeat n=2 Tax=Chitinophaga rupis TaxID=573321 RepID=A0A1H8A6L4_9BACT|nr:Outer membrane protein assembly factor BamB, contains PQQ-like beta-propeller repeat [Chitinophaga rupis]
MYMKYFVACFCWMIVLCGAVCMPLSAQDTLFRFAMVSDTHIGSETAKEDLERTIRDINAQPDVAFVMFSGDITEFGSDEELQLAKSIISRLNKPWYIVPGNHDAKWSESGCNTFRTVFGAETFSFQYKGYWFLGTSCGPNMRMGPGQIPRENIVWLEQQLQQQPDKKMPIIFVNHYPQDSSLNNWYEVLDRMKDRNLKAIICGHGHANHKYNFEGIPGIMCRSNLRAKAAIGGYNLVSMVHDSLVFNERRPEQATLPVWHAVALHTNETPQWMPNPPRPRFEVNQTFPQVHEKWSLQEQGDIGSGVAIVKDKVIYTNTNGDIKAVTLKAGKPVWQFSAKGKIYATPLVQGNNVIVPCTDGNVYCLDARNGQLRWQQATQKAIVSSAALYRNTAIIAGSDGHCRAWDINSGQQLWDFDSVRNFVETKPLIYNNKVYFGSWGNDLYALDANTGHRSWTWNNGASNRMFSPAACWPAACSNKLFIVAPDQYMTALDANTGQQLWRHRDTANRVRESMGLSPDSNRLYAKTMQGAVIAFNTHSADQEVVWKSPVALGYEICPSPINEYRGVVYVPTQSGVVYALSAKDGSLKWMHKFSNCLVNTVQPVNEKTLIATAADGKVVCLEL